MKACVYGAGAIGGHVAVRLVKGGADVSVVARGPHLATMQRDGLRMHAPDEDLTVQLTATDDPARLGPQDVVIIAVKAPALASVAERIAPLLGPQTAVVFAMNGIPWWYYHAHGGNIHGGPGDARSIPLLDPGDLLHRTVGVERAIGCVVYSACTVTAPGVVHVENATNRLVLGEPDGTRSARVEALAEVLVRGGMKIDVTEKIRDAVWAKLLLNLGSGMLGVLTASAPRDFYLEDACHAATRQIVAEAAAIAAAVGCTVAPDPERQIANGVKSGHKTSILQDLERGRPMEIDALYTVPLQMAREAGVPTPTLDLLAALTRARARAAGLYNP